MSRVITFSRQFPSSHPKKGEPTYFVEQILNSLYTEGFDFHFDDYLRKLNPDKPKELLDKFQAGLSADVAGRKLHTIRRGYRWSTGDMFSPRVWSGAPYRSPQIIIAEDIEIKRNAIFNMDKNGVIDVDYHYLDEPLYRELAKNDGLTEDDMFQWLMPNYEKPVEFYGQILIWTDKNLPY